MSKERFGAVSPEGRSTLLFPFQTNQNQSSYAEEIDGERCRPVPMALEQPLEQQLDGYWTCSVPTYSPPAV